MTYKRKFVYTLSYPEDNVRYIGCTEHPERRLKEHFYSKIGKSKKSKWINDLYSKGLYPIMHVIDRCEEYDYHFKTERLYYYLFKSWGFDLFNIVYDHDYNKQMSKRGKKIK